MNENLIKPQSSLTISEKLTQIYKKNRNLIFLFLGIVIIGIFSISYYYNYKENKKVKIADSYIQAKILISNGNVDEGKKILKEIIYLNDSTYSTISLFLILNENIETDIREIDKLFDHLLKNNSFDDEIENLIIFKKALLQSNELNESQLLEVLKPVITKDSLWKPHALLLLGNHYFYKKEYLKAKDFFLEILSLKNLHKDFYDQANLQLSNIAND